MTLVEPSNHADRLTEIQNYCLLENKKEILQNNLYQLL